MRTNTPQSYRTINRFTHRFTRKTHLAIALLMCLSTSTLWYSNASHAQSRQPINIEADKATLSEKQGKSVYSGNVVLTQGDIRVTADVVTVLSSEGKLSQINATGSPVTYYQRSPENDISGEAMQLDYFASEERVVLLENAKLSQGRNTFSGNRIEYHTRTEVVTAAVSEQGAQRVQVTIHPEEKRDNNTSTDKNTLQDKPAD